MTRIIAQVESLPESYPAVEGVTGAALETAWQRIEHYIAWRYSPRSVIWRLEAHKGEWLPPLAPIVSLLVQEGEDMPYAPETGPMGGWVLPYGTVTVTATVGAGPVPAAVTEAVSRYAKLIAFSKTIPVGATRFSSGSFNASMRREELNPAMAMVNSGAADLLRGYRRV